MANRDKLNKNIGKKGINKNFGKDNVKKEDLVKKGNGVGFGEKKEKKFGKVTEKKDDLIKKEDVVKVEDNEEEEKPPRYKVVKTLIRGKQAAKKNVSSKGKVKITYHKKPVGYVVKDLKENKLMAVSHLEVVSLVLEDGATNVFVTQTYAKDGKGGRALSPYIRAISGMTPLQDASMVVNPDKYLPEHKEIEVSKELALILKKKVRRSTGGRSRKPKFSKEALLKALKTKRAMLGLDVEKEVEDKSEDEKSGKFIGKDNFKKGDKFKR